MLQKDTDEIIKKMYKKEKWCAIYSFIPCQKGKLFKVEFGRSDEGSMQRQLTIKRVIFNRHIMQPLDYKEKPELKQNASSVVVNQKTAKQKKFEEQIINPKMLKNNKMMFEENSSNNSKIN